MRISDWSSDVCSSDLQAERLRPCLHGLVYATRDNLVRPGIRMAIPLLQDERIDIDAVEGAGEVDDLKAGGFCQLARPSPLLGPASGRDNRRTSEERPVGKGCVSNGRYRWSPSLY